MFEKSSNNSMYRTDQKYIFMKPEMQQDKNIGK